MRVPDIRRQAAMGLGISHRPPKFLPRHKVRILREVNRSREDEESSFEEIGTAYAHIAYERATVHGEGGAVPVFQLYVTFTLPQAPWLSGAVEQAGIPELGMDAMGMNPLGQPPPDGLVEAGLYPAPGLHVERVATGERQKIISRERTPEGRVKLRARERTT